MLRCGGGGSCRVQVRTGECALDSLSGRLASSCRWSLGNWLGRGFYMLWMRGTCVTQFSIEFSGQPNSQWTDAVVHSTLDTILP